MKNRFIKLSLIILGISLSNTITVLAGDVSGNLRFTSSEDASRKIYSLDDKMQENYAATQRLVGENLSPVIMAMFNGVGGKYILRQNGRTIAVEPVPPLYQQMKSVSHTIVGVFEIIAPYLDSSQIDNWKPKLEEYNQMLKNALKTLSYVDMPEDVKERCKQILSGGVQFTDNALETGKVNSKEYTIYAQSVWPAISKNVELAGKLQVDHFEDLLNKWRKMLGEDEWSKLYAVVASAWAMRRENVHFQILAQMMGKDAINDRLIMAETIQDATVDDLNMLLGRVVNDRDLAILVFGKKLEYRMDVELMGEAARDETIKRSTPHHPAINMDWEPYEEHKMPNEK